MVDAGVAPATPVTPSAATPAAPATGPKPPAIAAPVEPNDPLAVDRETVKRVASRFVNGLLLGDARSAFGDLGLPFQLEARKFTSPEELFGELLKELRDKRVDLVTLYGVEVFTAAEMEAKHGKPPARLAGFPYRASSKAFVAVANLSGHPATLVLVPGGRSGYQVVAYSD